MRNNKKHVSLEERRDEIARCVKCGSCSAVCPAYQHERDESFSARGRMALIHAVLDGRLGISEIFKDRLATCTTCLACQEACPSNVPVMEIIQAAKERAVAESGRGIINSVLAGTLKHPGLIRAAAWLAPVVLHYSRQGSGSGVRGPDGAGDQGQGTRVKGQGLTVQQTATKGRVAFFPGCAVDYFQPDIEDATIGVLNAIGYQVVVPGDLKCCGRPLLSLGDRKAAEELAAQNAAVFHALQVDAIVTSCASCGLTFKREYPDLLRPGMKMPVVLDIHEFLTGRIEAITLRPLSKSVTIHDPCHLGRGQGLSRTVRDLLQAIPGLTLLEMKDPDRCCGFGGVMRITHRELSDGIADEKIRNVISTGASAVVTGCPGCRMQIADALRRCGSEIGVVHPVQLLKEALE